jgi:hypothetical protein
LIQSSNPQAGVGSVTTGAAAGANEVELIFTAGVELFIPPDRSSAAHSILSKRNKLQMNLIFLRVEMKSSVKRSA